MQSRTLGKTDLKITPLGLGCWQFAQSKGIAALFWPAVDPAVMDGIVQAALAGGINWFDTAEIYGGGNSERALAAALGRQGVKPGAVTVATKWWPLLRTAASMGKTLPTRQAALAPYPVDLLQIHQPVSLSSVEKQAAALAKLLKDKQVRAVGISNFGAAGMRTFHHVLKQEGFVLASNQVRFSLADRAIEANGTLDTAKELGITIIAYSPLAQGLLSGRFHDDPSALKAVRFGRRQYSGMNAEGLKKTEPLVRFLQQTAAKHGASASQVALNWLVSFHGETVVAIPGASKVRHAEEAAGALNFSLSATELTEIDRLSRFSVV
jgi:aryl-alcohol dehydrogenase-like predicted oxidoreductase